MVQGCKLFTMEHVRILTVATLFFGIAASLEWSYSNQTAWPLLSGSSCGGMRQSPINIEVVNVQASEDLEALVFNNGWDEQVDGTLTNTGHTVQFSPSTTVANIANHKGTYDLKQFHFHWGVEDSDGSEHRISSEQRSAEIHFVHSNQTAAAENAILSVVSVLCKVIDAEATGIWATIVNNLPLTEGTVIAVEDVIMSDLLPDNRDYYFYMGSLTTPLCGETVLWFVLKDEIEIPRPVLEAFRTVEDSGGMPLTFNFRDEQALNDRVVQTTPSSASTISAVGASVAVIAVLTAVFY